MNQDKIKDRVRGSIIGGAIGDALGYPVEFIYSFEGIQKRYGENGITRLDTSQWWTETNTGKAVISDDTQMTLFTAMGLLNTKANGMAPVPSICNAYIEWLYTQNRFYKKRLKSCWISDLPELNVRRAPGLTCISTLETIMKGREPINNSKGCGGIMRIAPIPLYGLSQNRINNVAILNELAADASKITHEHPLGYIPAYITSHIIYRLATDEFPTRETFKDYVCEAMQMADEKYNSLINELQTLHTLIDKALILADQNIPDHEAIREIGEGWVAEETLAIAIYCVGKHFKDFEKALIASVNHGGDSDSTGAVTGNILGAAIGYDAIPQYFKNDLELHDVILHVADDLWLGKITKM
ncbi:MAG: ADP-ribosylglycohydrolase family protein [Bacteroidaceae bacterium]|nr:ADP-ribosylglycohydrolase family protein [Bacteroidaceae bacterium]